MFFIGYSAQGTELRKCSTDWIIDKQMMQISFVCGQNSIKKIMRQAEKEKQKNLSRKTTNILVKPLTKPRFLRIIYTVKFIKTMKNDDEDSREYPKVTASRRWCKTGTSKTFLNITSELQLMKQRIDQQIRWSSNCRSSTVTGTHMNIAEKLWSML